VQDETRQGDRVPVSGDGPVVKAGAYLALFLLGATQALIGTFQFGRGPGSLVAICFALAILVTCVLGAWGMRSAAGAVLPAIGWFIVSLVLGTSSSGGSVLVTNTAAGKWFLFGGAVCAAGGAVFGFARWSRPSRADRRGPRRS
jgi:Family of unknown function (DUF6113)